jgi:hypothetical protein
MLFESASPSIVRSVKQRDLLNTWLRLRARSGTPPSIVDYNPARLEDEFKDMVYHVVDRDAAGWRFVIASQGSRLSQAYGTGGRNNIGTELRDYVGPDLVNLVLPIYEACANKALPIYSISVMDDIHGRNVAFERLLMPFAIGGEVNHIMASVKAISDDGKFEMDNLLRRTDKLPEYRLRAVIDQELASGHTALESRNPSRDFPAALAGDVVEL